ncbi:MAG: ABC transporter ATP-binding protein/permease [Sphaerochaetaceae bacterium]|nr:ABC transporter ATP-binding protein/permease [Sphaerochaetaceae bacterium]
MKRNPVFKTIFQSMASHLILSIAVALCVIGAIVSALLPPLVLERIVDTLASGGNIQLVLAISYFAFIALTGLLESARETLLTALGQKITHALRSSMLAKLSRLSSHTLTQEDPGVTASRFVNDVDTVENLFTSGIISMIADLCRIISIFVILFVKNRGLALVLVLLVPGVFAMTRAFQKRMLKAQIQNRVAVGRISNHIPETIRTIRTIHTLGTESHMRAKYDKAIQEGYDAVEKNNFYDSIFSPIIVMMNVVMVAIVYVLASTGNASINTFFGMGVGTAVAVVTYISEIFSPLQSIGMEIQTIQSAVAGVHRIAEFMDLPERWPCDACLKADDSAPSVSVTDLAFAYEDDKRVLDGLSFEVHANEHLTLCGRTGCGKSTTFKLLLGQYKPLAGSVRIHGQDAYKIPDSEKRRLFGYVEQNFSSVPGTVADQIRLFDATISDEMVMAAAKTVGLHETIMGMEKGYDTMCQSSLFSQGQWQLLSIARAIAAQPEIMLLDEITANLDAQTEKTVLRALKSASENRTVISISHRLYETEGGRTLNLN